MNPHLIVTNTGKAIVRLQGPSNLPYNPEIFQHLSNHLKMTVNRNVLFLKTNMWKTELSVYRLLHTETQRKLADCLVPCFLNMYWNNQTDVLEDQVRQAHRDWLNSYSPTSKIDSLIQAWQDIHNKHNINNANEHLSERMASAVDFANKCKETLEKHPSTCLRPFYHSTANIGSLCQSVKETQKDNKDIPDLCGFLSLGCSYDEQEHLAHLHIKTEEKVDILHQDLGSTSRRSERALLELITPKNSIKIK